MPPRLVLMVTPSRRELLNAGDLGLIRNEKLRDALAEQVKGELE
jgi:hypothetical protein